MPKTIPNSGTILQQAFDINPSPNDKERAVLAEAIGFTYKQVSGGPRFECLDFSLIWGRCNRSHRLQLGYVLILQISSWVDADVVATLQFQNRRQRYKAQAEKLAAQPDRPIKAMKKGQTKAAFTQGHNQGEPKPWSRSNVPCCTLADHGNR